MPVIVMLLMFISGACFAKESQPMITNQGTMVESYKPTIQPLNKCIQNGGQITTKYNGAHKTYQICVFEDNRQCEMQALEAGVCPIGGIKITGYDNLPQVYCAIQGGQVLAVKNASCTLPGKPAVSALKLYNSK